MSRAATLLIFSSWQDRVKTKWARTFIMQTGPKHDPLYIATNDRYAPSLAYGKFQKLTGIVYDTPRPLATRYGVNPIVRTT